METEIPKNLEPSPMQVRAVRAYLSKTQAQLAESIGISVVTLLEFENAKRKPTSGTRSQIGLGLLRLGIRFDDAGNMILPPEPPQT